MRRTTRDERELHLTNSSTVKQQAIRLGSTRATTVSTAHSRFPRLRFFFFSFLSSFSRPSAELFIVLALPEPFNMIDNLDTDRFAPPLRSSPPFGRFASFVLLTGLSSCSCLFLFGVLRLNVVVIDIICTVTWKLTIQFSDPIRRMLRLRRTMRPREQPRSLFIHSRRSVLSFFWRPAFTPSTIPISSRHSPRRT